jgi:ligand-binding sensor domain-containing protein
VWIAAAGQVYALTDGDAGLAAWPEQPALTAVALGADASGALWVVDDAGGVRRRTPDAVWAAVALPEPIAALGARPESAHVWLFGVSGRVFHGVGETLSEVTNAPGAAGLTAAASADGSVLLAGAGPRPGAARGQPGRGPVGGHGGDAPRLRA